MTALTSLNLDDHLAKAGPTAASFARLWGKLWQQDHIKPELLDLCRLTLARLHDDTVEQGSNNSHIDGLTPARRKAVLEGRAFEDAAFSDADRAALMFAEYYWTDTQGIPDEAADDVKKHFGEPGLVFLIEALGCIDGRIRTARCLRDIKGASHVH